jgi:PKD repeat protein
MDGCIDFLAELRYFRFMRKFLIPLFLVLMAGCSSHQDPMQTNTSEKANPAKLTLTSHRRQGFTPLSVSFSAKLTGVNSNDKDYYCLKQEWDYGDGAVSSEEPNCEPFTETTKIEQDFVGQHTYGDPGNYTVRFTLGDKKVRSNQVGIVVLEGNPSTSP